MSGGFSYPYLAGRAANGLCFATSFFLMPSSQYPYAQLWNPANNNLKFEISYLSLYNSSSTGTFISYGFNSSQLTGTATSIFNKLANGGPSTASTVMANTSSAISANRIGLTSTGLNIDPANVINENDALILPPGNGFCIYVTAAVSGTYSCTLQWSEIPV
jgi:hypothetical protein